MKRTIYKAYFLFFIFSVCSCSTYSIQKEINKISSLPKIKKAGIIFRISKSSKITKEESIKNCLSWLSVYRQKAEIAVIVNPGESVESFSNPQERFYQISNENDFLKYKSIGVLNLYLKNNQDELLNIFSKNNLDCLVIYEVYSIISPQMQFFEFESVLAVIDPGLNIVYLDHQSKYFDSESTFANDLKNQAMDKIADRLMDNLGDMDLLGEKIENEKRSLKANKTENIHKPEGKDAVPAEKIQVPENKAESTGVKPSETNPAELLPEPSKETTGKENK